MYWRSLRACWGEDIQRGEVPRWGQKAEIPSPRVATEATQVQWISLQGGSRVLSFDLGGMSATQCERPTSAEKSRLRLPGARDCASSGWHYGKTMKPKTRQRDKRVYRASGAGGSPSFPGSSPQLINVSEIGPDRECRITTAGI